MQLVVPALGADRPAAIDDEHAAGIAALEAAHRLVEEGAEDVHFVVVFVVEFLTFLGLEEGVGVILVAVLYHHFFQLLAALHLEFQDDPVLEVVLHALESVDHLLEVFNIEIPA